MNEKRMELIQVPYYRLLKLELPSYVNSVIDIIERFEPETLMIDSTFNLLVAQKPQIDKLDVGYRSHPLTKKLEKMRKLRSVYVSTISNHLKVVESEDEGGDSYPVSLVKVAITRFLENLSTSKTEVIRCEKVTRFFATIYQDEQLEQSFESLGFKDRLDHLKSLHYSYMQLTDSMVISLAQRPTEKTADLKKSVIMATQDFFKHLELAPLMNEELDYKPLYDQLNKLSTKYRNMINRRSSYNKRKAEGDNPVDTGKEEESIEVTNSSQCEQPLSQKMFHLDVDELKKSGNGNGFEVNLLKKENAAAPSEKQKQLRSVNSKD